MCWKIVHFSLFIHVHWAVFTWDTISSLWCRLGRSHDLSPLCYPWDHVASHSKRDCADIIKVSLQLNCKWGGCVGGPKPIPNPLRAESFLWLVTEEDIRDIWQEGASLLLALKGQDKGQGREWLLGAESDLLTASKKVGEFRLLQLQAVNKPESDSSQSLQRKALTSPFTRSLQRSSPAHLGVWPTELR